MLKRLTVFILVLVASSQTMAAPLDFLEPYDGLLRSYITKGKKGEIESNLVDYKNWARDSRHKKAMQELLSADTSKLQDREKMAFWVNAYNLLTIDLITKNREEKSIKNLGSIFTNPWRAEEWKISGKEYTLDEIDREILRKMKEPRIHFALSPAALSGADLRNEVYQPDRISDQLDSQAESFLRNPYKGARIENGKIKISSLFKWSKDEFGGPKGVEQFVRRNFQNLDSEQLPLEGYMDYNWTLNSK